jgi:chromatin segregation and condensation protein Rec8/ScpA/Scc1 (kleisin family)
LLDAAFEAPRPAAAPSGMPALRLCAYEGPLDLLLELARAQRVDLTRVPILALGGEVISLCETGLPWRRRTHRSANWPERRQTPLHPSKKLEPVVQPVLSLPHAQHRFVRHRRRRP